MDSTYGAIGEMLPKEIKQPAEYLAKLVVQSTIGLFKERLTEALYHEPTKEDWQGLCCLLHEKASQYESERRKSERRKIRRMFMGNDNAGSQTK